jgi:hypothetical protein
VDGIKSAKWIGTTSHGGTKTLIQEHSNDRTTDKEGVTYEAAVGTDR